MANIEQQVIFSGTVKKALKDLGISGNDVRRVTIEPGIITVLYGPNFHETTILIRNGEASPL